MTNNSSKVQAFRRLAVGMQTMIVYEGAKRHAVNENANHVHTVITVSCSIVEPWATASKCFANKLTNFSQLTGNRINLLRQG